MYIFDKLLFRLKFNENYPFYRNIISSLPVTHEIIRENPVFDK